MPAAQGAAAGVGDVADERVSHAILRGRLGWRWEEGMEAERGMRISERYNREGQGQAGGNLGGGREGGENAICGKQARQLLAGGKAIADGGRTSGEGTGGESSGGDEKSF